MGVITRVLFEESYGLPIRVDNRFACIRYARRPAPSAEYALNEAESELFSHSHITKSDFFNAFVRETGAAHPCTKQVERTYNISQINRNPQTVESGNLKVK